MFRLTRARVYVYIYTIVYQQKKKSIYLYRGSLFYFFFVPCTATYCKDIRMYRVHQVCRKNLNETIILLLRDINRVR